VPVTLFYCTHEGRSGVPVLPPRQGRDRFGAPRAEAPQVGFPTSSPIRQRQRPSIRCRHRESMRCLDQPKRLMQMPPQPELRSCPCSPKAQASSPLPPSRTLARRPITPRPFADHAPGQDGAATEGALATRPEHPRRPTAPARVSPTWRSEPHSYNDPCNYLG
jgi:hypothetical protein